MLVEIRPAVGDVRHYDVADVTFTESTPGGYDRADFILPMDAATGRDILDAEVFIHGPSKPVWHGWVWEWRDRVTCAGSQSRTALIRYGLDYANTQMHKLMEYAELPQIGCFSSHRQNGALCVRVNGTRPNQGGTNADILTNSGSGYWYWADNTLVSISFDVDISGNSLTMFVYSSASKRAASTQVYTKTGAGTYTSQTATLNARGFVVAVKANTDIDALTVPTDAVTISNLKMFGDSTTSWTTTDVILNALAQLPTSDLPSGADYLKWVGSESTAVTSLAFEPTATLTDHIMGAAKLASWDFAWRLKLIAGSWVSVPVYAAKDTTASYTAVVDGQDVVSNLSGGSMDPLAYSVVVRYRDEDGNTRTLTRTDTDATHYLVKRSRVKTAYIDVDTTSQTEAEAAGDTYLVDATRAQVQGSLLVKTPITSSAGQEVYPCEIESGRLIRVLDPYRGEVIARITAVSKRNFSEAELTLEKPPLLSRLSPVLALPPPASHPNSNPDAGKHHQQHPHTPGGGNQ